MVGVELFVDGEYSQVSDIHFIVLVGLKLTQRTHLHAHRLIQCKYNQSSYRNCPRDPYPLVESSMSCL